MKQFLWILVIIFCFNSLMFVEMGQASLHYYKDKYKKAVDAGADAAEFDYYIKEEKLEQSAHGFGEGYKSKCNHIVEPDEALEWFYRVFFRNMSCEGDLNKQQELRKTFVFKALILFDKIMIADSEDTWVIYKKYEVEHRGRSYYLTLSEQMQDKTTGEWTTDKAAGLEPKARKALVSQFVREELNSFIKLSQNLKSGYDYNMNIAVEDMDYKYEDIDGVNIIVMCEGLPILSLNPWGNRKYYAFSAGGSEITFSEGP